MSLRLYRIHYTVRKFNNNSSYLSHQVIPHRQTYFPKHVHCCMFLAFTREALNSSPNRSHVTMDFICTGINNYGFTFAEYSFLSNETVHCLHTMRPRQNGRHFSDYLFKCIFLNDRLWISIKIPLKLVSKGPVDNIPTLVLITAWCRPGGKPLSEPTIYWRIYASLALKELTLHKFPS